MIMAMTMAMTIIIATTTKNSRYTLEPVKIDPHARVKSSN